MAVIFYDNFDSYTSNAAFTTPWSTSGEYASSVQSFSAPNSLSIGYQGGSQSSRALGSTPASGYFQFKLYIVGASVEYDAISSITFYDSVSAAGQITWGFAPDGAGIVYRGNQGGTSLGTCYITPGVWHDVIMYASIAGTGGVVQIAIDGNLVFNYGGNTKPTAHAYFDTIMLNGSGVSSTPDAYCYMDNLTVGSGLPPAISGSTQPDPIWTETFDSYGTTAPAPWNGAAPLSTTTYYSSPKAMEIGNGGFTTSAERCIAPLNTGSLSFEYYVVAGYATSVALVDYTNGVTKLTITFNGSGGATVYRGTSTSIGTFSISSGAWHLINISNFTINATTGVCNISVDGTSVLAYSGVTTSSGTTYYSCLQLLGVGVGTSPAAEALIDNITTHGSIPTLSSSLWAGGTAVAVRQRFMSAGLI